jgi:hypothetical protein
LHEVAVAAMGNVVCTVAAFCGVDTETAIVEREDRKRDTTVNNFKNRIFTAPWVFLSFTYEFRI